MAGIRGKRWLCLTEKQKEGEEGYWNSEQKLYIGRIPDGRFIEFESYEEYHSYMVAQKED